MAAQSAETETERSCFRSLGACVYSKESTLAEGTKAEMVGSGRKAIS